MATSKAPSGSMSMPNIPALRVTIFCSSPAEYISSRSITPNRSRKGEVSCPARVVAPMRVNLGRSSRMDRAAGPLPMMISRA